MKTFSVGFEESSFDELERARLVAERYGTDHHEIVLRPDAVELLPKLVEAFDEPFGDSSALPTYLVSELAAGEVKVALSGEGGDELFGGYYTYVADLLAPRVGRLAALAAPLIEALPSSDAKVSFDYKAKRFARAARLPPLERHHAWKEIFSAPQRAAMLGGRDPGWDPVDLYRERYAETAGAEPLARLQDVDLGIYLVDDLLVKTDRSSMAHSLELRVPFLDVEVAGFALGLATPQKVRGLAKKRLLRRALAPLLPKQVLRGPKQGFSIPVAAWLRGPLQRFAREVLSAETLARQGWLDPAAVTALLDRHCAGPRGPQPPALGPDRLHALVRQVRELAWTRAGQPSKPCFAFLLAGVVALLLVPLTDRLARRVGAIDLPRRRALAARRADAEAGRPGDPRRRSSSAALIWLPWDAETRAILAGAALIALVGMVDDVYELGAAPKLLGQTVAVVVPVSAGVTVDSFTFPFLGRSTPARSSCSGCPAVARSTSATSAR